MTDSARPRIGARVCRHQWIWPLIVLASLGAADVNAPLADAAKSRDIATVSRLLKQPVDVNVPQSDGTTALHWAVRWNLLEVIDPLIRAGANVNATNRYNITPLALACTNGSALVVAKLLQAGADPNASPNGESPLMVAARTGDLETVKVLLAHGAATNAVESERGQTALMWAAAEAHPAVVKLLIEQGADVQARAKGGFTPVLFGVRKGDKESVAALINAGASPNEKAADGSPLSFVAILNAHYELAAVLLDHGADPDATDKTGRTALHALIAARNNAGSQFLPPPGQTGNLDTAGLISALLSHGANPNARTRKIDVPVTRNVADAPARNAVAPPIDTRLNLEGATAFLLAAQNIDVAAMRILVAGGADPRLPTYENSTPLMVAAGLGSKERQGGPTPAAVLEAVRLTVELGGDVNAANAHGQTALHSAVYRGVDEVIQFLVAHGAKLDAKDSRGRTPVDLAEGFPDGQTTVRHESAAALLRKLAASRVDK